MDFQFRRHRIDKIPREKIVEALEKVARHFGYRDFKRRDFGKISDISSNTVTREFGTWEKALVFLKGHLHKRGIELQSSNRRSRKQFTEQQLFEEMERIWTQVGHRPSKIEWELAKPRISFATYMRYFNGWQNACLKFIEYKMGGNILSDSEMGHQLESLSNRDREAAVLQKASNPRTIPLGIRLKVLDRDNFRCVFCGRSPATEREVKLHIDHRIPVSQGGGSTPDNLQTLCQDCNLGKSDTMVKSR